MIRGHEDRDEIKRRAEPDFLTLFDEHGGRRRGKALLCPFHKDRNPSASMHRGRFYCFTCGLSLDVIEYLGRVRGEAFKDVLAYLAARYSVPLNDRNLTGAEKREYAQRRVAAEREARDVVGWRDGLLRALRDARDVYLHAFHRAKSYIIHRGLDGPAGTLAGDVAWHCEDAYQDYDAKIRAIERAPWSFLVDFYRRNRITEAA
jgi:hypothetical protein